MKAHLPTIVVLITLMACGETPKPIPAANYTAFRAETSAVVNANKSPAADSATEMVQAFYDWYVPLANNMSLHGAEYDSVLANQRSWLSPEFLAAFRNDVEVQRRDTSHDLVSVSADYDVFLNSQDPCGHYQARGTKATAQGYEVAIYGVCGDTRAPDTTAAILVEVARSGARWQIVNFKTPGEPASNLRALLASTKPESPTSTDSTRKPD
ncbi:MAG: hypothetical protein ACJ796_21775 [Gemmatimonadaceae bacterium]